MADSITTKIIFAHAPKGISYYARKWTAYLLTMTSKTHIGIKWINLIFYLTRHFRHVIIHTVNYIINLYSILVAKVFEKQYNSSSSRWNSRAMSTLEHYKNVRRMLPLMSDGNRMGNHNSYATLPNGEYAKNIYGGYDSFHSNPRLPWVATQEALIFCLGLGVPKVGRL